jgi:hypothetical protein
MSRLWLAIPASLALLICMTSVNAAPARPQLATDSQSMIEKVHGTHRSCVYSHARGWHRHVGPYTRTVSCGYPYYYEDPFWDSPGITFWFGPSPRYYRHRPYRHYRYYHNRPHRGHRR